jgi:regulator of sirC expression with transglutaminase-like and TPR domain
MAVWSVMANDYTAIGLLEDEAIDLDTSALALAHPDHPGLSLDPYFEHLTDLARRLVVGGRNAVSATEQADALATVIAGDCRYSGAATDYDHPDNADLIRVIDRRQGLPVSLAILYVASARRLGWSAEVLNTPGHVLVRIGPETDPLLIDPFNDGAVVSSEGLATLLRQMLGAAAQPNADHVAPMENRAVLVRLLLNQASRAEASGDAARALTLYERMTAIAPDYPQPWWDRARLEIARGDVHAARGSLSAMLEITRDVHVRNHVCAALDALSGA